MLHRGARKSFCQWDRAISDSRCRALLWKHFIQLCLLWEARTWQLVLGQVSLIFGDLVDAVAARTSQLGIVYTRRSNVTVQPQCGENLGYLYHVMRKICALGQSCMNLFFERRLNSLPPIEWFTCPYCTTKCTNFLVHFSPLLYSRMIFMSYSRGINETLQPLRPVQLRFNRSVHGSGSLLSIDPNSCIKRTVV